MEILTAEQEEAFLRRRLAVNQAVLDGLREAKRQIELWGLQTHPCVSHTTIGFEIEALAIPLTHGVVPEPLAKAVVRFNTEEGRLTWADILTEEVAEAYGAGTLEERREELVQVMAVCANWIADLDEQKRLARELVHA